MMAQDALLLLDDDEDFRAFAATVLVQHGWEVLEAPDAGTADFLLAEREVRLIVVDGHLPDAHGVEWIARRRESGHQEAIVFTSAVWRDLGAYRRLTRELGVSLVVYKPVDAEGFAERLDRLLQRDSVPAQQDPRAEQLRAELKAGYLERLPERIEQLQALVEQAQTGESKTSALQQSLREAHKLHGTAGCYGLPEVGRAMGRVEQALSPIAQGEQRRTAYLWRSVRTGLEDAKRLVRATTGMDASARGVQVHQGLLLVVDHDEELVRTCAAAQESMGLEVVHAATADHALAVTAGRRLEAAIVSLDLPNDGASGIVSRLRSVPGKERLPIAFVSQNKDLTSRAEAARLGGVRFLAKPVAQRDVASVGGELVALARAGRPKVLVADDDPEFQRFAQFVLSQQNMEVRVALDPGQAFDLLHEFRPDLLILDVMLPHMSGFDFCRAIRLDPQWDSLPVVFATAQGDRAARIETFRAGGDDYLAKPVVGEELVGRVRVRVERARLLRRAAEVDSLTGLLLRRPFLQKIAPHLDQARRGEGKLAICLIDLDHFKQLNDMQGHLAGDHVLQEFGRLVRRRLRTYDLCCRWGGEEILVAFPGQGADVAALIADRLRAELKQIQFPGARGAFHATFTAGIAVVPDDGTSLDIVLPVADHRLYSGKRQGRDQVVTGTE